MYSFALRTALSTRLLILLQSPNIISVDWESEATKPFYPTISAAKTTQWVFVLKPGFPWVGVLTVPQLHNSVLHPHHLALSVTKPITVKHVSSAPMPSTSLLTEIPSRASGVSVGLTGYCSTWQKKVTLQWIQGKINPENVQNSYEDFFHVSCFYFPSPLLQICPYPQSKTVITI